MLTFGLLSGTRKRWAGGLANERGSARPAVWEMVRLRTTQDVERVRRDGKAYPHPLVVVMVAGQPAVPGPTRAAVVAGRKVGSAVRRNRAKRLLREALRALSIAPGHDLVLIARAGLPGSTRDEAIEAVSRSLRRAGLLGAS